MNRATTPLNVLVHTAAPENSDRLVALLRANTHSSANDILNRLREAVISFSAHTPQHDDITMMILGFDH